MVRRSLVSLMVGALVLVASVPALAHDATPSAGPGDSPGLTTYIWEMVEMQTGPDTSVMPDDPMRYTLQFLDDGRVVVGADCNTALGAYTAEGAGLDITMGPMTLVLCPEDSLSDQLVAELDQAASFVLNEAGELVISLPADAGFLRFQPSLVGVVWEWTGLLSGDGSAATPDDPGRYTIEFLPERMVAVGADCNHGRGPFTRDGSQLDISVDALTRAMCPPDSLSEEFVAYLNDVVAITFADGQLHMDLPMDSGILSFRPQPYEPAATPEAG